MRHFCLLLAFVIPALAQDEVPPLPKPTKEHQKLAERAGTWKVSSKSRQTPDAEWMTSTGTEVITMACGGFWQQTVYTSQFMGMQFEGRMTLGFDTVQKKYVGTWVDNFATSLWTLEGTTDDSGKVMTLTMRGLDPMTGTMATARIVTTEHSKDHHTMQMFMMGLDGKEFLGMDNEYRRDAKKGEDKGR